MNQRRRKGQDSSAGSGALHLEDLEARQCLSGIGFATVESRDLSFFSVAADLNGDGEADLISANEWRENAEPGFGETFVFDFAPRSGIANQVIAVDVDGDRDNDLIKVARDPQNGREVVWFENLDSKGRFGPKQFLFDDSNAWWYSAIDVDGDELVDLVPAQCFAADQCESIWFQNRGSGEFVVKEILENETISPIGFHIVDIDGDDDVDWIRHDLWLENTDGNGTLARRDSIFEESVKSIAEIKDVDGDGQLDFFVDRTPELIWLEQQGASTELVFQQEVSFRNFISPNTVQLADFDSDGDDDLVIIETEVGGEIVTDLVWHEQHEGQFINRQLIASGCCRDAIYGPLHTIDVNDDGYLDLVRPGEYRTFDANAVGFNDPLPIAESTGGVVVAVGDIDGDGDLDSVKAVLNYDCEYFGLCGVRLSWSENRGGGDGINGVPRLIMEKYDNLLIQAMHVTDVDGDGDNDLLYQRGYQGYAARTVWQENLDGQGSFAAEPSVIESSNAELWAVEDFDGDGRSDLLLASDTEIYLHLSDLNAASRFTLPRRIVEDNGAYHALRPFDWDRDGDLDIVATRVDSANNPTEIVWLENLPDEQVFGAAQVILTDTVHLQGRRYGRTWDFPLQVNDFDGDGDIDILKGRAPAVLYQNETAQGANGEFTSLPMQIDVDRELNHLKVNDLDNDGDIDLLVSNQLFVNDGQNRFEPCWSPTTYGLVLGDMDNDGDTDLVGYAGNTWHQNRPIGDSNNDGVFNSSDLVLLMQSGRYENEIAFDGTFETGDWNRDGEVDSSDLVYALSFGNYQ